MSLRRPLRMTKAQLSTARERNAVTRGMEAMFGDVREAKGIPEPVYEKERGPIVNRFEGLTEEQEQVRVIVWWSKNHESYGLPVFALFHIPNGGHRDKIAASRLKNMGLRPGVPDLCLAVKRSHYAGLYVELKRSDGGSTSSEQIDIIAFLILQGYCVKTAWGAEKAKDAIVEYLGA